MNVWKTKPVQAAIFAMIFGVHTNVTKQARHALQGHVKMELNVNLFLCPETSFVIVLMATLVSNVITLIYIDKY